MPFFLFIECKASFEHVDGFFDALRVGPIILVRSEEEAVCAGKFFFGDTSELNAVDIVERVVELLADIEKRFDLLNFDYIGVTFLSASICSSDFGKRTIHIEKKKEDAYASSFFDVFVPP